MPKLEIHKIKGIIEDINKVQKMIDSYQKNGPEEVADFMIMQFNSRKRKYLKELFIELVDADINFREIESFIEKFGDFSEKTEKLQNMPKEVKMSLAQVEQLMVG